MSVEAVITDDDGVAELVDSLRDEERYAIDTEFHRERTYFPKLALVQVAWADQTAIIDPLAVSVEPLAEVLDGPGLAILHAATQDLEVLYLACGTIPTRLFDTQVAAGFIGMRTPSLASLHDRILGKRLTKEDRLTDWLRRPLRDGQLAYARSDVEHLLELHDRLTADLDARGRHGWALDECEEVRRRGMVQRQPADAWLRIKEARHLKGARLSVAQAVAQWREERAAGLDTPPRHVMSDLAVIAIAQKPPSTLDELRSARGVDGRHVKEPTGDQLLQLVAEALERPPPKRPTPPSRPNERNLRPVVTLVAAWLGQLADEIELDPSLIGTRSDIEDFLRGADDSRLGSGWRAKLVGQPIRRLVDGEAALALEPPSRLVLEERSGRPIGG